MRTRREGLCYASTTAASTVDCTSGIERFVWSGDDVLWEMRGPGGNTATATQLNQASGSGEEYGTVGYTHAGGVDRPLVMWKGAGATAATVVVAHLNWRGLFGKGTDAYGYATTAEIEWPGFQTTASHSRMPTQMPTKAWFGSVVEGQRDAGGQMYMRNRYYDPATGQFTQTDPIGIAGGLNTYGFAAGDPVSYSDPYGLCPTPEQEGIICLALFISQPSTIGLKGDNRGFSSTSDPNASRAYAIINPETREVTSHWNESCTSGGQTCNPARSDNSIAVDWDEDGSFAVTVYGNQSVYPAGPAINSGIRFHPQADGSYKTSGYADAFPSIEAYQYRGGQTHTIVQRPEMSNRAGGALWLLPFFPKQSWDDR